MDQPRARPLVTIVVPAKNEERTIGRTIQGLPRATLSALGFETEVVVLDGQSRDRTAQIAHDWGATVLQDEEPGKGSAFRRAVPLLAGDIVVMVDADATYAADAIPAAVAMVADDGADVVVGRRRPQPGAMRPLHRVGNRMLSLAASVLYGRRCADVCTGLWAFRAEALRRLPLSARGFDLEAELWALSCRSGLSIAFVDVDYLPREGAAKLSTLRDGWRIAARLLRSRVRTLPPSRGPLPQRPAKPGVGA
ncbi:MAG TPA: glycosyltransferase family 2 protein [Candidatus Thermoplasmatota archaeon]|nr:glycosyltransferase family 2 protein [Candidatus Thermoplasmatota archaeon]